MHQGIIQQCDKPIEIYTHPGNQFVSDFIGRSNFLTCEVVAGNIIRLGNTTFPLDIPQELKTKSRVMLSFRPQHVEVHGAGEKIPSDLRGLVLKAKFLFETFLGTFFQLEVVTIPDGRTIMVEVPLEKRSGMILQSGSDLLLTVPEEHIRMFKMEA
jgi:ABC-type Fe3+/spermidine/putrescine transport system ATPase subunit